MTNDAPHKFTPEETKRGYTNSARVRKGFLKLQRFVANKQFESKATTQLVNFFTMFASTPVGSVVIAWFLIDLAQKTGWINIEEAYGLKAVITSDALLGALGGGQGIGSLVGGLSSAVSGLGGGGAVAAGGAAAVA